jgi:transcriptional regulator with XRE-family HTH domain
MTANPTGRPRSQRNPKLPGAAFGARLLAARTEAGLSVLDAAKKIRVTVSTWYRWERGEADLPLSMVRRIARALGVEAAELIG